MISDATRRTQRETYMNPPRKGKQIRSLEKIRHRWENDSEKGKREGLGEHEAAGYKEGDKEKRYLD